MRFSSELSNFANRNAKTEKSQIMRKIMRAYLGNGYSRTLGLKRLKYSEQNAILQYTAGHADDADFASFATILSDLRSKSENFCHIMLIIPKPANADLADKAYGLGA